MILSCCFRDQANKKNKYRKEDTVREENNKKDGVLEEDSQCLLAGSQLRQPSQHSEALHLNTNTNTQTNKNKNVDNHSNDANTNNNVYNDNINTNNNISQDNSINNKETNISNTRDKKKFLDNIKLTENANSRESDRLIEHNKLMNKAKLIEHNKVVHDDSQRQRQQAWAQWSNKKAASAFDLQLAQKKLSPSKDAKPLQLEQSQSHNRGPTPFNHVESHQYTPASQQIPHQYQQYTQSYHFEAHQRQESTPLNHSTPHQEESRTPIYPSLENTHLETSFQQSQPSTRVKLNTHSNGGAKTTATSIPNLSQHLVTSLGTSHHSATSLGSSQIEMCMSAGRGEKLTSPSLQTDQTSVRSPSRSQVSSPSPSDTLGSIPNSQDHLNVDTEVFVSQMQRSTASYAIKDLIKEQEENEKRRKLQEEKEKIQKEKAAEQLQKDAEERLSKRIREEYESIIEKNRQENEMLVKKLQTQYELKLQETVENHRKKVDIVIKNGKNEQMAVVMRNEQELKSIRENYEKIKTENDKNRQSRVQSHEETLKQSLKDVEAKDRRWKEDKQEVLDEIQRLKGEAARMVAILSSEVDEEEEELSEEQKKTLKQEAESLQLVVEMRTKEMRKLKEKQAKMEMQLEEFQMTKTELQKMRAKVEDLQEQMANKSQTERNLYREKTMLEDSMEAESRASARMSLEMEQLQWRIRNSLDLPPMLLTHSMSFQEDQDHHYLQDQGYSSLNKNQRSKSAPCTPCKEEGWKTVNNLEHVEEVDGQDEDDEVDGHDEDDEECEEESCDSCVPDAWTSADPCQSCLDEIDSPNSQYTKCLTTFKGETRSVSQDTANDISENDENSDFKVSNYEASISSEDSEDERISVIANEALNRDTNAFIDSGDDTDSLDKFNGVNVHYDASDEGLGDISSENESMSPQPNKKLCDNFEDKNCVNNVKNSELYNDSRGDLIKNRNSPSDNRVPSRIPFETPL